MELAIVADDGSEHALWHDRIAAARGAWRDVHVSLAPLAGRQIRLRFSARPTATADAALAGIFGEPVVTVPRLAPIVRSTIFTWR